MVAPAYATRQQLYAHGLPAAAFVAIPRPVQAISGSTFTLEGHGYSDGALVRFTARGAGVPGAPAPSLPAPLVSTALYEVVTVGGDMFTLKSSGVAVTLTTTAVGTIMVAQDNAAAIDEALRIISRDIDDSLSAHETPLVVVPDCVVLWTCKLTAVHLLVTLALQNRHYRD